MYEVGEIWRVDEKGSENRGGCMCKMLINVVRGRKRFLWIVVFILWFFVIILLGYFKVVMSFYNWSYRWGYCFVG